MKTLTAAVVMIAVLTAPAFAQGMGGKGGGMKRMRGPDHKTEQGKKPDDKAYKAALDKIPASEKPDPWRNMR